MILMNVTNRSQTAGTRENISYSIYKNDISPDIHYLYRFKLESCLKYKENVY